MTDRRSRREFLSIAGASLASLAGAHYLAAAPPNSAPRSVAVTFDDFPFALPIDASQARAINIALLNALDRYHVPAIGFVIGQRIQELQSPRCLTLIQRSLERDVFYKL